MKTIIYTLTLAILMMFGSPMLAAQNEPTTEKPMARQMEKMHSQMQTMQQQMKDLKATNDPETRKELMHQHMQSMRKGMNMMSETDDVRGGMMMGKMDEAQSNMAHTAMHGKKNRMACQQEDAPCQRAQTMEHRQEDMQERMKMMQMMMQQMMEHLSVQAEHQ